MQFLQNICTFLLSSDNIVEMKDSVRLAYYSHHLFSTMEWVAMLRKLFYLQRSFDIGSKIESLVWHKHHIASISAKKLLKIITNKVVWAKLQFMHYFLFFFKYLIFTIHIHLCCFPSCKFPKLVFLFPVKFILLEMWYIWKCIYPHNNYKVLLWSASLY